MAFYNIYYILREVCDVDLSFIFNMDILAIVCFVLGFILVIIEMFIPGFGIAGISGIILLVLGVIQTAESLIQALIILIFILLILGAALTIMIITI